MKLAFVFFALCALALKIEALDESTSDPVRIDETIDEAPNDLVMIDEMIYEATGDPIGIAEATRDPIRIDESTPVPISMDETVDESPNDLVMIDEMIDEATSDPVNIDETIAEALSDADWIKPTVPVLPDAPSPGAINSKIVGGSRASAGQIPHQVHLLIDSASLCGGSLISTRYVLTAAHCLFNHRSVVVRMGSLNWRLASEASRVTMTSTTLIVHPSYNSVTLYNDVGLVLLPSNAPRNTYINTISLPRYSDASKSFDRFTATASGWGTINDAGVLSSDLLWTRMPIISNAVCQRTFGSYIVSSTICTSGAGSKSICRGDSGGPLTVLDGGVQKLVGVNSFVYTAGCQLGYPQGYARVTSFLTWISQRTGIYISP